MNKLAIACGCTHSRGLLDEYRSQVEAAGIPFHVEKMESPIDGGQIGLGRRLASLKAAIEHCDAEKVVFTDAYDVLFYGTAEGVYEKISPYGVLLAAERNCFPESEMAPKIAATVRSIYGIPEDWRAIYANGGMISGRTDAIQEWIEGIEQHPEYDPDMIDQGWYNRRLAEASALARIDLSSELMYCMYDERGELQVKDGRPWNSISNTFPAFIHLNGRVDVSELRKLMEAAK